MYSIRQQVPAVDPRRKRIYYGWANLAVAALAMVGTLPGRTQGLGMVTEPLISDLGVDRITYATINLWATLAGSLLCLPCGRFADRFGPRSVLTVVLIALSITVLAMSRVTGLVGLAVAITLTRGLGQSALSVVSLALVGKWFGRGLNYAMGVYSLLVGVGFITAFLVVGDTVLGLGWRAAWSGIGWVLLFVFAPLAWLIVRDGPEDRGLQFDEIDTAGSGAITDLTLTEALRSRAFWLFALSSSVFGLVYSGISLFNQSILEQRGFDASVYYKVLSVSTMLGLAANFAGGWLASRWPIQRLMGLGMAALGCALLLLPVVDTYAHVLLYAVAMGVSGGVVTVVLF
jgi:sugar phosphate permease